jgi:hypothetical protein
VFYCPVRAAHFSIVLSFVGILLGKITVIPRARNDYFSARNEVTAVSHEAHFSQQ